MESAVREHSGPITKERAVEPVEIPLAKVGREAAQSKQLLKVVLSACFMVKLRVKPYICASKS